MEAWIEKYVNEEKKLFDKFPTEEVGKIVEMLRTVNIDGRQLFVFGNGGSAATVSHFITDINKSVAGEGIRKFKCMALNESNAWMTAIGNDFSYEEVFTRQLENFANEGDVVLVVSVSGTSPNLLNAANWAKEHGLKIIALLGRKETPLKKMADLFISVPDDHYGRVEDMHAFICHVVAYTLIEHPELLRKNVEA